MSFDSPAFLVLLVASMVLVRLPLRGVAWGLLGCSALFYAFAGAFDFMLFAAILIGNGLAAVFVARSRAVFWLAVAGNIAVLAAFKYRDMLLPSTVTLDFARVAIPLGISFYLFHILAYLSDLRTRRVRRIPFHKFVLFVSFFPHLIAGPIVRVPQLAPQLDPLWRGRIVRRRLAIFGLALFFVGLVKKVVFSNSLGPVVDGLFRTVPKDMLSAWAGAWLFGFQIYFDFSGYTDMALGSAMLLGVRLPQNFRTPYLSVDPQEFWRRWHVTLSSWIRDYLYIPLGGRAGGSLRQASVLLFVMALAGLWHGANWAFVAWGALWGLYILLWRLTAPVLAWVPRGVRWAFHLAVVMTLWVFFRSPDIDFAVLYIVRMYSFDLPPTTGAFPVWALVGCALLLLLHRIEAHTQGRAAVLWVRRREGPFLVGLLLGLCLLLLLFPNDDINPFIYFRF
jgi:alginate O-acetyltransferase complex protein AlgI